MPRIFVAVLPSLLLGLLAFAAQAQNPQVLYATLQLAQQPSQFVTATLKATEEAGSTGFFLVTGNSLELRGASYLEIGAGPVTNGSKIELKRADGRFLGCCNQGAVTFSSTAAASFIIHFYTAAGVKEFQARAARNPNTAAAFSALDADDGAGK